MPARPPTVERTVELNLRGAQDPGPLRELDPQALLRFPAGQVCLLDIRDPKSFDAGHLKGSINLPAGSSGLGTRAGWAAGADEPIVLVSAALDQGRRAAELLRAAGVWNLEGVALADPEAWKADGLTVRTGDALDPDSLVARVRERAVALLDVRDGDEWAAGHIAGSRNLPLSELGDGRDATLALEPPLAVLCASGARAALAASILRRRGHEPVWRVSGGIGELAGLGVSIVGGPPPPPEPAPGSQITLRQQAGDRGSVT